MATNTSMEKIDYAQVETISKTIKAEADKMKNCLNQMKTEFKIAGSENWTGTAANEVKKTLDALSAKFNDFYEAVKSENTYLDTVVANYKAAEKAAKDLLG